MDIDRPNRRGRFNASGTLLPEEATDLAAAALSAAGAEDLATLTVDFKRMALTRRMTVTECHHVGERLARAGRGLVKVAFITSDECNRHHAFLFTVAANRGLRVAAFVDEGEALRWLGPAQ